MWSKKIFTNNQILALSLALQDLELELCLVKLLVMDITTTIIMDSLAMSLDIIMDITTIIIKIEVKS